MSRGVSPSLPRRIRIIPWLSILASFACGEVGAREPTDAEILWDDFGVPHVFAESEEGLFRAFGWAQMESHGNLVLRLYGQARGRAAEYFGGAFAASDRWVRTVGIPERADAWYAAQEGGFRDLLDAFVAGMNGHAEEFAERLDPDARAVLPVVATDVLAHLQRVIHFTCLVDESVVFRAGADDLDPAADSASPGARAGGSNAWAIAPERTEAGHALLLANPHLPWGDRFQFYEAQLVAPGVDLSGAALVGFPVLVIGFNERLGWTHTLNTHDGADLYELALEGDSYRFGDGREPLSVERQSMRVRGADGMEEVELAVARSVHGPLVATRGDRAFALRVVGLDRPDSLRQWWAMGRAANLAEFEAALRMQQIPTFTVMYADREGNVLHQFGGLTPVRALASDEASAAGVELTEASGSPPLNSRSRPVYPGARPMPGDAPAALWREVHGYDELPRVLNPESGWLQNANDPPWTTTFPAELDPARFPSYLAPRFMHLRAQRSALLLMGDERISFDELVRYKHSTRVELADRLLDDLLASARDSEDELVREAALVLAAWDRSVDAASDGAVLFLLFAKAAGGGEDFFAERWDPARPTETPRGVADADRAVAALASAARTLKERAGTLHVKWGDVFRLQGDGVDLPCSGGMEQLGIFRVFDFVPSDGVRNRAAGGDSFVAAVEFSDPVRAQVITTYGNATQPGSRHRADQLPLAARQELRPALRIRAEIEAALESREWVPFAAPAE